MPLDNCGMAMASRLLEERWTLLIIREALYGVTRFDAMQADLGLPRSVLSNRLKRLVEAGILAPRAYREPGQRTRKQYVLTPMGIDLALPLIALMQWGDKYLLEGESAAKIVSRKTGAGLSVAPIDETGKAVPFSEIELRRLSAGQ